MEGKMRNEATLRMAIPVLIDKDHSLGYETYGFMMRVFRFFVLVPLMRFLVYFGRIGNFMFGLSSKCRKIKRYATNYLALELIYTFGTWFQSVEGILDRIFSWIWLNISNGKAVRNRLKLVKKELQNAILSFDEGPNIISIGSGSARAIIEILAKNKNHHLKVTLLDHSRYALGFSKKLAERYAVTQSITWARDYAQNLEKHCNGFQPDIVEMVGLLDYFDKEGAINLIEKIYQVLAPGGILITCNIRDNSERDFVTHIINWPMIYRSPEELAEIVINSGFDPKGCRVIYEPLKLHGFMICKKFA